MSSPSHGYDVADGTVLGKTGQEVDSQQLQRYKCVFCGLLLRDACQLACGDRSCRVCLPKEYVSIFSVYYLSASVYSQYII